VTLAVVALCWGTTQWFAGRAAYLIAGATLATIMSANVFFVIIPGQKRLVAALARGESPNPLDGARGKQRSVHNTYFTLPVVFAMLAVHFGAAFAHPHNWAVLVGFMLAGALIRQFFVLWHSGGRAWPLLGFGMLLLIALGIALAPWPQTAATTAHQPVPVPGSTSSALPVSDASPVASVPETPDTAYVQSLMTRHCTSCHSATPKLMPIAPKAAVFDTPQQTQARAAQIAQQVAVLKIMPPGNLTGMTDEERAAIARWATAR
jgi:uncharacterized membrane protein